MDTDAVMLVLCEFLDLNQNKPIRDILYEAFKRAIVLGRIPAGTPINEKQMSQVLHISRTPVRSALNRLMDESLVVRKPGSGVVVQGISRRDAADVYEIRTQLEVYATIKAAHNMTEADFDDLRLLLESGQSRNAGNDVDGVISNMSDFNTFVYAHADNKRLQELIESLNEYTRYFRDVAVRPEARREIALRDHWNIYLAMRFESDEKIESAVRTHLASSYDFVKREMISRGIA